MAEEAKLTAKEEKEVDKEVKLRLHQKVLATTKEKTRVLKMEFKKQTATAIMAAFGLIIALSWKDVITDWVSKINFISGQGLLISAVFLTLISVLGILIIAKWAQSGSEEKK